LRVIFRKKPKSPWKHGQEQGASLLRHSRMASVSTAGGMDESEERSKKSVPVAPSYWEVFSPQSNINLLTYTLLALHSIAYDQLLPVFMHLPPQLDRSISPDVQLPLKFAGGFGIDVSFPPTMAPSP
jgi:hypothetical protein